MHDIPTQDAAMRRVAGDAHFRREEIANPFEWSIAVAEIALRELHLVKKALAIAILVIERQVGPFQSTSDQTDMKELLDRLIVSDTELARYAMAAKIAVTGSPT